MAANLSNLLHLHRKIYLLSALVYMGIIYILSSLNISMDDTKHPHFFSFLANLFHFPLYTGLGLVLILGFRPHSVSAITLRTQLSALVVLCAYGAFDEYHQSWSGRTPSVMDFYVDLCGGVCAVLVLKYILEKKPGTISFSLLLGVLFTIACCLSYFELVS